MFRLYLLLAVCVAIDALNPSPAFAQSELSSCKLYSGDSGGPIQHLEDSSRFHGTRDQPARILCDNLQFFADFAEIFKKQDLISARGHVVFVSGGNRIWADRMEFNTKTRTGVFYNARGTATLGDRGESTNRSMF